MNTITTLLDLKITAAAAALAVLGEDALTIATAKTEAFKGARHDPADFHVWQVFFVQSYDEFESLKTQASPAGLLAKAQTPAQNSQ